MATLNRTLSQIVCVAACLGALEACGTASFSGTPPPTPAPVENLDCERLDCDGTHTNGATSEYDTSTSVGTSPETGTSTDENGDIPYGIATGYEEEPDVYKTALTDGRVIEVKELDNQLNLSWLIREFEPGESDPTRACTRSNSLLATREDVNIGITAELKGLMIWFVDRSRRVNTYAQIENGVVIIDFGTVRINDDRRAFAVICVSEHVHAPGK